MKALKIKVDFKTGIRAGGINPKSKNFRGHSSWQDLDNGWEVRLVLDEDVDKYRRTSGVTVLEDEAAIEAELSANFAPKVMYKVTTEALLSLSISQINPDLSAMKKNCTRQEELEFLYNAGIRGIERIVRDRKSVKQLLNNVG